MHFEDTLNLRRLMTPEAQWGWCIVNKWVFNLEQIIGDLRILQIVSDSKSFRWNPTPLEKLWQTSFWYSNTFLPFSGWTSACFPEKEPLLLKQIPCHIKGEHQNLTIISCPHPAALTAPINYIPKVTQDFYTHLSPRSSLCLWNKNRMDTKVPVLKRL